MIFLTEKECYSIWEALPLGLARTFLDQACHLWTHFQNYQRNPPMALVVNDEIVSIHFASFNHNGYTNSFELVTLDGHQGKGYARKLWSEYTNYAVFTKHSTRLKNSCVLPSIPFHIKSGLIFWGIDSAGSLKTDQPLYPTVEAQLEARKMFIKNPKLALPKKDVVRTLTKSKLSSYHFGENKRQKIRDAIQFLGRNWLGDFLE